jgi:large subunit ribosomal protein L6
MGKRKNIDFEIEFPSEITAIVNGQQITMKKGANELKRIIGRRVEAALNGNKIVLSVKNAGKDERRELGSAKSHIKNMIEGLMNGFEYELEICNVHFPMTLTFDKAKSQFIVKNQLGEKSPRVLSAPKNIEVEIKAPKITLKSFDLEVVSQAAGNLEKLTRIRNRDRNKFQDGIFITKKPGRAFS